MCMECCDRYSNQLICPKCVVGVDPSVRLAMFRKQQRREGENAHCVRPTPLRRPTQPARGHLPLGEAQGLGEGGVGSRVVVSVGCSEQWPVHVSRDAALFLELQGEGSRRVPPPPQTQRSWPTNGTMCLSGSSTSKWLVRTQWTACGGWGTAMVGGALQ